MYAKNPTRIATTGTVMSRRSGADIIAVLGEMTGCDDASFSKEEKISRERGSRIYSFRMLLFSSFMFDWDVKFFIKFFNCHVCGAIFRKFFNAGNSQI